LTARYAQRDTIERERGREREREREREKENEYKNTRYVKQRQTKVLFIRCIFVAEEIVALLATYCMVETRNKQEGGLIF